MQVELLVLIGSKHRKAAKVKSHARLQRRAMNTSDAWQKALLNSHFSCRT